MPVEPNAEAPVDLWPARASFTPSESARLTAQADQRTRLALEVTCLGRPVTRSVVQLPAGLSDVDLGRLDIGGYAVTTDLPGVATAFDVLDSPLRRPRYGFLSEFAPDRADPDEAIRGMLRLHQSLVQFYDWMHRHADLIGEDEEFTDACGRRLSHRVTRDLIHRVRDAGALPMAYAAVYGVGKEHAADHPDQLLYHADRTPRMLADLLCIANLDPSVGWAAHIIREFRRAIQEMGFAGLHLDSYGTPKIAWDATGRPVDLAEQFPVFLRMVRVALPHSTLIFNNVNDYPTFATAPAPQDVTYIEVWDPHREYRHLVSLIERARGHAADKPVVLAAYLTPFADDTAERSAWAARLALATVFAHGGHYLLCGEGNAVLTHPYYPKFARLDADGFLLLRRYFDYAVALGDLLYDPAAQDVTRSHLDSDENDELQVVAEAPVSADPLPGRLWAIARRGVHGMTVHLIDLTAQSDVEWNRGKRPGAKRRGVQVRLRWPGAAALAGSPEAGPDLRPAATARDGDYLQVSVPAFHAWATVHFPRHGEASAGQA